MPVHAQIASRHRTVPVSVGGVIIGGGGPIVVQSMTNTDTADIDATVEQVAALARAGSELVRVTVDRAEAAQAVPHIRERLDRLGIAVPLVGDFHYIGHTLLRDNPACAEALAKYRINPGNVGRGEKHDRQFSTMIEVALEYDKPVRIGVNWGSLDQDLATRMMDENALSENPKSAPEITQETLVVSATSSAERAEELGMARDKIILSCKVSEVQSLIAVYRLLAGRCDYALHLGLTEAGMGSKGIVASTAALSVLLQEGIGDTIRISYAADPVIEIEDGKELLYSLKLRPRTEPELIACPTCGRIEVDLIKLVQEVRHKLESIKTPVKVAVMGCVVNGPGEAEGADVAVFAGRGKGVIYVQGEQTRTVTEDEMLEALHEECLKFAARVERGEVQLSDTQVNIVPPDPLPREDGSIPLPIAQ